MSGPAGGVPVAGDLEAWTHDYGPDPERAALEQRDAALQQVEVLSSLLRGMARRASMHRRNSSAWARQAAQPVSQGSFAFRAAAQAIQERDVLRRQAAAVRALADAAETGKAGTTLRTAVGPLTMVTTQELRDALDGVGPRRDDPAKIQERIDGLRAALDGSTNTPLRTAELDAAFRENDTDPDRLDDDTYAALTQPTSGDYGPVPDPREDETPEPARHPEGPGRGFPRVAGRCPACGWASLFLAVGEHVTCSRLDCPDPCAADELLDRGKPEDPAGSVSTTPDPAAPLTFELYEHIVRLAYAAHLEWFPIQKWRLGQAYSNVLHTLAPRVQERMEKDGLDCFYRDDMIPGYGDAVRAALAGTASTDPTMKRRTDACSCSGTENPPRPSEMDPSCPVHGIEADGGHL